MNQKSKDARTKLKMSTRREFEALVYESLLTPLQERIVRLHIAEGVPVPIIAMRLAISEAAVRSHLAMVYVPMPLSTVTIRASRQFRISSASSNLTVTSRKSATRRQRLRLFVGRSARRLRPHRLSRITRHRRPIC